MCGGGGGSSAPTSQTVTQVTIPPELMPYAKRALGTAENLTYNQPYQTYGGQRIAGLNPLQQQAMQQLAGAGAVVGRTRPMSRLAMVRPSWVTSGCSPLGSQPTMSTPFRAWRCSALGIALGWYSPDLAVWNHDRPRSSQCAPSSHRMPAMEAVGNMRSTLPMPFWVALNVCRGRHRHTVTP